VIESPRHPMPGMRVHWILAAWIGIVAAVALFRSVDLLWSLVILLIFACVAAAVLPQLQLLGVRVRRLQFPVSGVVGKSHRVGYEVEVASRLPRYGLEIHERLGDDGWSLAAFVPHSQGRQALFFDWTPQRRGCWQLADLRLESRYPLGVARGRRMLDAEAQEIVIYPDCVPLPWLPVHGDARGLAEDTEALQRGGRGEFFALKPYQHGDEARSVHWRASARLGEVVTREHQRQEGRQLWVVLDLAAAAHAGAGPNGTCEQMIRIAHSAIVKAHSDGIPVGLLYRVADAIQRVPASADRSTFQQLRDTLARVQPHAQVPVHGWLPRFHEQLPVGGTWLLFNLAGERQRATLQAAARQRSAIPLVVEFDLPGFTERRETAAQPITLRSANDLVSIVPYAADVSGLFRP
jgi:uncharacterized protein (DUF58 family)